MSMLENLLRGLVIAAGLLLPGAGWAWGNRWPLPWFAAGVISTLTILAGLTGFACLGIAINLGTLAVWAGMVAGGGGFYWWQRRSTPAGPKRDLREWWLAWPLLPMLVIAVWRAATQPLPGVDADFRWDHLARLIVQHGHMDFYPPVSTEGFAHYFWADGIAPLVSGLYVWTYVVAGNTAKVWTTIPVLLQIAGLAALVHALARRWQPEARAGWFACGLAGGTMLLQFSINLGQETGLTALGVGGLALYLMHWQRSRETHLLVPAAACAGLVACAREYGVLFLLAGMVWVGTAGRNWRSLALFTGMAAAGPLLWHLRVWYLTGNPLYAHDVAGLFPVNPVFHAWMQGYVEIYGKVFATAEGWKEIGRLLTLSTLPAGCGMLAGMLVWRREAGATWWSLLAVLTVVAWVASVPFTAGGLFYSMRVLSPVLLLGCAWGGAVLARWVPQRRNLVGLLLALGLFGTDAALRALTIPLSPYATPMREWPQAGYRLQIDFARENEPFLAVAADRVTGRVLSESAGVQHLFQRHGKTVSPLWSPEVQFLFTPDSQGDAADRLQGLGYSHVLLTRVQSSVDFLVRTGALRKLDGRLEHVMSNDTFILFALKAPGKPVTGLR
jgi:hypothetical protein